MNFLSINLELIGIIPIPCYKSKAVYGSIVIHPKKETLVYDKSGADVIRWTNEKPMNVLRNLKRGNEWYGIRKGLQRRLIKLLQEEHLDFWRQRMGRADVADVYYPAFLINGKQTIEYPDFKPGER
jgi:hypothetical protein